jgi:hypothetical protein
MGNQFSWIDVINLAAAIASIMVAVVAIGIAVYFYVKGRDSEARASAVLTQIQTQVAALDRLAGKMLDRLTKAVTEPRPEQEALLMIVSTLNKIPESLAAGVRSPGDSVATAQEVVANAIGAHHYAAMANTALQLLVIGVDEGNDVYTRLESLIETSYQDVLYLDKVLSMIDGKLLESNRLKHLYDDTVQNWRPSVKSALDSYKVRHPVAVG